MKIIGITAEYNPFHNGHGYHLKKSREVTGADYCVAVMSGNFVQRGEPALLDKYLRTKMCLLAGVDLVLELPVFFATASAEAFAYGAMKIMDASGLVDCVSFGSEVGGLRELKAFAKILSGEDSRFTARLKANLNSGLSYPMAQAKAAGHMTEEIAGHMNGPNNILGVEYLKALEKLNSKIIPNTVRRESAGYHSKDLGVAMPSATAIRMAVKEGKLAELKDAMPEFCYQLLKGSLESGEIYTDFNVLSHIFQYTVKTKPTHWLRNFTDVNEGLENRIIKCAERNFYLEDILSDLKTKRYTLARLRRILLHIILDLKRDDADLKEGPKYIRVLGFKKDRAFLVSELKRKSSLPVVTNLKDADKILDAEGMRMLEKEIYSTSVYYLSRKNFETDFFPAKAEYKIPMVMI